MVLYPHNGLEAMVRINVIAPVGEFDDTLDQQIHALVMGELAAFSPLRTLVCEMSGTQFNVYVYTAEFYSIEDAHNFVGSSRNIVSVLSVSHSILLLLLR